MPDLPWPCQGHLPIPSPNGVRLEKVCWEKENSKSYRGPPKLTTSDLRDESRKRMCIYKDEGDETDRKMYRLEDKQTTYEEDFKVPLYPSFLVPPSRRLRKHPALDHLFLDPSQT